jgi:hypothetical protein
MLLYVKHGLVVCDRAFVRSVSEVGTVRCLQRAVLSGDFENAQGQS